MSPAGPRRYPWKTFAFLTLAGTLTSPLIIPYLTALSTTAPNSGPALSASTAVLAGQLMLRSLVLVGVAAGLGLLVARKIGLGAPYLEHWLDGGPQPAEPLSSIVKPALFWVTLTALLAFAIDAAFVRGLGVTVPAPEIHAGSTWRGGRAGWRASGHPGPRRSWTVSSCCR